MKRIIVIGCPGSGKSRLAIKLHEITGIPLHHLDLMYWNSDRTTVSRDIFLDRLGKVLSGDEWIIDGNYASTMDMRMDACDTVIFLDFPTDVCLLGITERRGKPRPDMPWIESTDCIDSEFTEYVREFTSKNRPEIISLLERHKNKKIYTLKSREEADAFLEKLRLGRGL